MPVVRYFLFVGGVLLALLLALDAFAPQQVAVASNTAPGVDKTVVRIRSDQKLPERVVYDTSLPTIVPPAATVQAAAAPVVPMPKPPPRPACVTPLPSSYRPNRRSLSRRFSASARLPRSAPIRRFASRSSRRSASSVARAGTTLGKLRRDLSRQLWNFFRKSVVAGQPLVFLFVEAALGDAFRGRCLRLGLR